MGLTGNDGVLVTSVIPGSPAADANVQPGTLLCRLTRYRLGRWRP
jgi:S1-C subfamily serine protease